MNQISRVFIDFDLFLRTFDLSSSDAVGRELPLSGPYHQAS
jgi:hypothetical protein